MATMAVLKGFHRLGLVQLRAMMASLMPTTKRARFAKAALKSLGLRDVPVASSTFGQALPSHTYTKSAAFAAPLTSSMFVQLQATSRPISAQVEQNLAFYKRALESDPEKQLSPFMDQKWFLAKTDWHHRAHTEGEAVPTGKEVTPYLSTKIVPYDVHAALSVACKDVVSKSNVFQSRDRIIEIASKSQGKVVEVLSSITHKEVSTEKISLAMSSPLKGSLNRNSAPSDSETLCQFCNSINFEAVGFHESGFHDGPLFDKRRPLWGVLQNAKGSKCVFCKEVAESFSKYCFGKLDIWTLDRRNDRNRAHYEMVSLDSVGPKDKPKGQLIRLQVTLKVLSRERVAYGLLLEFQRCSQHPPTVKDFCDGDPPSNWEGGAPYSGRIRPLVADIGLFRKWIETCDDVHPHPHCGVSIKRNDAERRLTFMGLDGLRLIEVENMCVVDVKGNMAYTALSYVWGDYKQSKMFKMPKLTTENRSRFREAGSLREVMLPKTIVDAIELTKSLGYGYIWIDCLCIVQGDEIDERYFIPEMDVIFGCAVVTIIAASGDDADAGLAGVRANSRTRIQKPFKIKGVSLMRTLDPERSDEKYSSFYGFLKDSKWCKRGWTFQEKLLSPRALIFTEEQVYWECQTATWCEDGLWETIKSPTVYRHCLGDKDYRHPWEDNIERRYQKIVEEYSGRSLKYEKDRRDAFEGIIERFQWDAKRTRIFLWALPKRFLSNALTWHCKEPCPVRRKEQCRVTSEWGQPIKDCPFPSWSWLGWEGKVCYNATHGRLDAETVDLIFYYFSGSKLLSVNQTGATQSLSEMGVRKDGDKMIISLEDIPKTVDHKLVMEADQSNILFFWSSTARLHIRRHEHVRRHGAYKSVDSYDSDELILSHDGKVVPAKFWFHTPSYISRHGELIDFVVIGKFAEFRKEGPETTEVTVTKEDAERDTNLLAVLLVEWKNGVAYRQGLVHIDFRDWVVLGDEVLNWKLIFLG